VSKSAGFFSRERKPIRVEQGELVRRSFLDGLEGFPLVFEPNLENVNLTAWVQGNREAVARDLLRHGAILFRGFGLDSVDRFESFTRAVTPQLIDYRERAAPRVQVGGQVYTSTEFPADQWIPLHHEMSYSHNWPTKIYFYCEQPARSGGRTPIAEDRKVLPALDREVKAKFLEKKVMYVRNYGEGVDLPWQEAFQTTDPTAVEDYCRKAGAEVEWRGHDRLRTRSVRQVVATHPQMGETVWFNHAHMFHMSNLEPQVLSALLSEFAPDELPRNAFYGDGSAIEVEALDHIRKVYRDTSVSFPWQQGDVLLLDNFLVSHGREPFQGPRRILVAMAELYTAAV
jgi:alpha-ketoglutarate-dependent taurine dioxygenase